MGLERTGIWEFFNQLEVDKEYLKRKYDAYGIEPGDYDYILDLQSVIDFRFISRRTKIEDGELTELNLRGLSLKKIPESLRLFYGLRKLDISYNRISDISSCLADDNELEELIAQSTKIDYLPLNKLNYIKNLRVFNEVKDFDEYGTSYWKKIKLKNRIIEVSKYLPRIEILNLRDLDLSETIIKFEQLHESMKTVSLSSTNIEGIIGLDNCINLENLYMEGIDNSNFGKVKQMLSNLSRLKQVKPVILI